MTQLTKPFLLFFKHLYHEMDENSISFLNQLDTLMTESILSIGQHW